MRLEARSAFGTPLGTAISVSGFASESVALRERADIGCVLFTAGIDIPHAVDLGSAAASVTLPVAAGCVSTGSRHTAMWLSPRSWLVQCGVAEELELVARLNAAFVDKGAHAVGFTDALCWFELSGDAAGELLAEGGFVSLERGGLPVRHAKRTIVAQVAAVVTLVDQSVWLVGVERSRGRYFAEWLIAAARAFQGKPHERP